MQWFDDLDEYLSLRYKRFREHNEWYRDFLTFLRRPFEEASIAFPIFLVATLLWVGWVYLYPTFTTFFAGGVELFSAAYILSWIIHWISEGLATVRWKAHRRQQALERERKQVPIAEYSAVFHKTEEDVAQIHAVSDATREALRQERKARVKAAREYYKTITGEEPPAPSSKTADEPQVLNGEAMVD